MQVGIVHQPFVLVVALGFNQEHGDMFGVILATDMDDCYVQLKESVKASGALDIVIGPGLGTAGGAVELVAPENDHIGYILLCNRCAFL